MKTVADVQEFERVEQQLHSMLGEMSELSKKKPNDAVNKFKLKLINVLITAMNKLLETYKPFNDFDTFDDNDLPTNSDVVVMLSQYNGSTLRFRTDNTEYDRATSDWIWRLPGKGGAVKTKQPREFRFESK